MKKIGISLLLSFFAATASAQVSDSTAITGFSGAAPTLDCAANQVKVGSSCALIVQNGVTENAACVSSGWGTIGFTSGGVLLSCQSNLWKKASGSGGIWGGASCMVQARRNTYTYYGYVGENSVWSPIGSTNYKRNGTWNYASGTAFAGESCGEPVYLCVDGRYMATGSNTGTCPPAVYL